MSVAAPTSAAILAAAVLGCIGAVAHAHLAHSNWTYPPACCRGHDAGGDCQAIPPEDVISGRSGYSIMLHPGDHALATRRHLFFVPYGEELLSGDGNYHVCLHPTESDLNCFFVPESDV